MLLNPDAYNQTILVSLRNADNDALVTDDTYEAGSLPLNGPLCTAGNYFNYNPQFLVITSDDDESGNVFSFTGKDAAGLTYNYSVNGPNTTTLTIPIPYEIILSGGITISENTTGNIKIGVVAQTATPWIPLDLIKSMNSVGITVGVSSGATLNYSIQATNDIINQGTIAQYIYNDETLSSETASGSTAYTSSTGLVRYVRLIINSWTSGTALLEVVQAGSH